MGTRLKKINVQIVLPSGRKLQGYILDISPSGLGISLESRLRRAQIIDLYLKSREALRIGKIRARVVHIQKREASTYPYKAGLRFFQISEDKKLQLFRFLARSLGFRRLTKVLR